MEIRVIKKYLLNNIEQIFDEYRNAAVLVPIYINEKVGLILVKRPEKFLRHSGEISFPGGLIEGNEGPKEAALREAYEEIGLRKEDVEVLGFLEPTVTRSTKFRIYPLVGLVKRDYNFKPNVEEVEEIIFASFEEILMGKRKNILGTYFKVGKHVIWGATARIIVKLLDILEKSKLLELFQPP